MKGKLSWACLLLLLLSCSKAQDEGRKQKLVPPRDEASPEQRTAIDETLSQIEALTSALGHPRRFRELPVVVTSDDRTYTDHPAACVFDTLGSAQFILLKPSVLEQEAGLRDAGVESALFRVLLHEIGHCYFGRQHEEARLFENGKSFELNEGMSYPMLDATVMVPEELTLPVALERYYVAELLGLYRARSAEELPRYAPVRLVRASTP